MARKVKLAEMRCTVLRCAFFVIAALSVFTDSAHAQGAQDVLAGYVNSLSVFKRASIKSEIETTFTGAWNYDIVVEREVIYGDLHWDSPRFDIHTSMVSFGREGTSRGAEEHRERRSTFSERGAFANQSLTFDAVDAKPPMWLIINPLDDHQVWLAAIQPLQAEQYLHGFAEGHPNTFHLEEIMQEGSNLQLRDEMEPVDGHKCYVLESKNEYGEKTLWLDPEDGFNPRRIVLRTRAENIYGLTPLGAPPEPLDSRWLVREPRSQIVENVLTVDSVEIEEVDGVPVIVGAQIVRERFFENGLSTTMRSIVKRTHIDLNPDFEAVGAFKMEVPDGTPVFYPSEPSSSAIRLEWRDGKVVPTVDTAAIDAIEREIPNLAPESTPSPRGEDQQMKDRTLSDPATAVGDQEQASRMGYLAVAICVLIGALILGTAGSLVLKRRQRAKG